MKTTIEFEDNLYFQLKAAAVSRRKKVRELVAEGVRMVLRTPPNESEKERRVELPLIKSKRTKPLDIPDDIASRLEVEADLERYAASLRQ